MADEKPCPVCDGTGKVINLGREIPCRTCGGTGVLWGRGTAPRTFQYPPKKAE